MRIKSNLYALHDKPLPPLRPCSSTLNTWAWPDSCFRSETVKHPRTRESLAFVAAQFNELEVMPKERELIKICRQEKAEGRKTLVYSIYTGTRDTTSRLKLLLEQKGIKVAVLRASVDTSRRSWCIGQEQPVKAIYLGYAATSQMTCLGLMARKIMVSQSTSGDVPESGLDVLNQDGDSVEVALARQLVAA